MVMPSGASEWHDLFNEQFVRETDRAAVILSAAMLNQALKDLLRARLVPIPESKDSLFRPPYGPISSFSARIDLAYRMGLISAKMHRELHLIRKIRNDFAHDVLDCNFENVGTKDRIRKLMQSSNEELKDDLRDSFPDGVRGDFQFVVSWILWHLSSSLDEVTAMQPHPIEWGYKRKI